jgi:hypothetical protein
MSHVDWCKFCVHFRSLNIRYFVTAEAVGLGRTSRFLLMNLINRFKLVKLLGVTSDGQMEWLYHKPFFHFLRKEN